MEKSTKTILLAVFILFIAIVSFNFNDKFSGMVSEDVTGNPLIMWDVGDISRCRDSDGGDKVEIRGKTVQGRKVKYDSCRGSRLTEYYCSKAGWIEGSELKSKTHDCKRLGYDKCLGGVCVKWRG